jgi:branched-subunit amino acid transport protein
MTDTAALVVLVVVAAGTYTARGGLILLLAGRRLPISVERALRNVGPAVLAALTINLAVGGEGEVSVHVAEVGALVVATGVAVWRRNLLWTLAAGMGTLWILTALT